MKILKKIWSILKELNKLIFGYDLEEYSQNNETEENNSSQATNNENITPEEPKPETGILEPFQGLMIVKKSKDNYVQIPINKRIMIIHYTNGDNHQKENIKLLKDKDWKWNS